MKTEPTKITQTQNYKKGVIWFRLIGITGSAQILVQAIGFFCGILVIRNLSTDEYALYTLANTVLGTLVILANSGISTGVTAQGGKVWKNKKQLGEVIATGLNLKKKFTIASLLIGLPILIYLLLKNDASWLVTIMIVLSLIPAFFAAVSNSLLEIAPKLKQDVVALQKNQLAINFARLFVLGILIFIFPFAFVALLAAGLPQVWGNLRLWKIAKQHADLTQKPSKEVQEDILKTVKRVLPDAIYFSISSQVTIWLLSILGSTTSVAQIGALGRISALLSLIVVMFTTLVTPRFARLEQNFKLLLSRYLIVHLVLILILGFVVLVTWGFPEQVLWILGPKYMNLQSEIVLALIASSIGTFASIVYFLYSSRGWIIHPIISIAYSLSVLVIAVFLLDVSTLRGALFLNIILAFSQLLMHSIYGALRIYKLRKLKSI